MGRRADTRQRMVEAGITLFGKGGYTNVSLLDVVEEAKAPRGSIYHHFPGGKDELATEVAAAWRYRSSASCSSGVEGAERRGLHTGDSGFQPKVTCGIRLSRGLRDVWNHREHRR